jgi:hypothetical protein
VAYVTKTNGPEPVFINVGAPVGSKCRNAFDDVRVVQLMLKEVLTSAKWQSFLRNKPLTGQMDGVTDAMILLFQNLSRENGGSIVADGRIDPAKDFVGPIHHQVYTIIQLNVAFKGANPAKFKEITGSV